MMFYLLDWYAAFRGFPWDYPFADPASLVGYRVMYTHSMADQTCLRIVRKPWST